MSALAAFHLMLPIGVALLAMYALFRLAFVLIKLALIVLLFTALGSGLVYTPGYQAVIHMLLGTGT